MQSRVHLSEHLSAEHVSPKDDDLRAGTAAAGSNDLRPGGWQDHAHHSASVDNAKSPASSVVSAVVLHLLV